MMKQSGQKLGRRLINLQQRKSGKSMFVGPSPPIQCKTSTALGGSGNLDLKPGKVWIMGRQAKQPKTCAYEVDCTLVQTEKGELVISGDTSLLRQYFESSPEQWLRCLALTKESKDGKT